MESASDRRFDPNYAAQLLLDIAHEQSLDSLLQKVVASAVGRPEMACSQIWLIDEGDICASCRLRQQCPDQSRCLHLVAARGAPLAEPAPPPRILMISKPGYPWARACLEKWPRRRSKLY